jgi:hypothetical protein
MEEDPFVGERGVRPEGRELGPGLAIRAWTCPLLGASYTSTRPCILALIFSQSRMKLFCCFIRGSYSAPVK